MARYKKIDFAEEFERQRREEADSGISNAGQVRRALMPGYLLSGEKVYVTKEAGEVTPELIAEWCEPEA